MIIFFLSTLKTIFCLYQIPNSATISDGITTAKLLFPTLVTFLTNSSDFFIFVFTPLKLVAPNFLTEVILIFILLRSLLRNKIYKKLYCVAY